MGIQRVVLAMSGGVDSSVAAHLLLEQGYEVVGVFMRHGDGSSHCATAEGDARADANPAEHFPQHDPLRIVSTSLGAKQGCCTAIDALDARRVADRFGIPFYALNLERDFDRIIDYFVAEYTGGRTPNPCVVCNHWVKFGRLFDYAQSIDAQYVATGHYAQLLPDPVTGELGLHRGRDPDKDQSYVLFGVERARLQRMLLPVGRFRKPEIRQLATRLELRVADKQDSQEICFVPAGRHAEFVRARSAHGGGIGQDARTGEIVTTAGDIVGHHAGIEGFTIGQRRGLGVAMGEPYFVVRIEPDSRRVVIGRHHELARCQLTASRLNWLIDPPERTFDCLVQIRYNSAAQPAAVTPLDADRIEVRFAQPCHGVAPGQAVVCYDGQRVLGGGWIDTTG